MWVWQHNIACHMTRGKNKHETKRSNTTAEKAEQSSKPMVKHGVFWVWSAWIVGCTHGAGQLLPDGVFTSNNSYVLLTTRKQRIGIFSTTKPKFPQTASKMVTLLRYFWSPPFGNIEAMVRWVHLAPEGSGQRRPGGRHIHHASLLLGRLHRRHRQGMTRSGCSRPKWMLSMH